MKCPYCNKEAKISDVAKINMETYGRPVNARSECCGKILSVHPKVIFSCEKTIQRKEDDWGH